MTVRKKCPRCSRYSTVNTYGAQYWGVESKKDGKLICNECGLQEIYEVAYPKSTVDKQD